MDVTHRYIVATEMTTTRMVIELSMREYDRVQQDGEVHGSRNLDAAALTGLRLCKFVPGSVNGRPVLAKTHVAYKFSLVN